MMSPFPLPLILLRGLRRREVGVDSKSGYLLWWLMDRSAATYSWCSWAQRVLYFCVIFSETNRIWNGMIVCSSVIQIEGHWASDLLTAHFFYCHLGNLHTKTTLFMGRFSWPASKKSPAQRCFCEASSGKTSVIPISMGGSIKVHEIFLSRSLSEGYNMAVVLRYRNRHTCYSVSRRSTTVAHHKIFRCLTFSFRLQR